MGHTGMGEILEENFEKYQIKKTLKFEEAD